MTARTSAGRARLFARLVTAATTVALLATATPAVAASPMRFGWKLPALQKEKSVPVTSVASRPLPVDPAASQVVTNVAAPVWPGKSTAKVTLPAVAVTPAGADAKSAPGSAVRAGQTPVSVRRKAGASVAGLTAESAAVPVDQDVTLAVTVSDQTVSKALGLNGVVFSVADVGGTAAGAPLGVDVDYSTFARAHGGDYATRLRLVSLPACALTTPDVAACRTTTPVAAAGNDVGDSTVSGEIVVPKKKTAERSLAAESSMAGVFAVAAAPGGAGGSYSATSLAPSGSWSAGGTGGDFNYSYPFRTPASPAGGAPTVSLGYSAQSLDGRTSGTNNQASWVGDGWDLSAGGFIERTYKPCSEDLGGTNGQRKTGDQCWVTDNATISLAGISGKLVKDQATGVWRTKNDDGAKVERFTSATNGDNDGEYWKVTTPDGTQYFLGLNRLPGWVAGKPETKSTWTSPVFGNHGGEPCASGTFAASWCDQAYRWNVDYVVDPHGNATSFHYVPETNFYGRDLNPAAGTSYVRGGYLDRIEYGLRSTDVFGPASGRVRFEVAERCIPGGAITCDPTQLNASTAASWPDVPTDQICNSGEQCTNRFAPTFFTRKRLTKVIAEVGDGAGGYPDVDSWALTQDFPDAGARESTPVLNLKSIVRTGHVGTPITLPPTTFDRTAMRNRIDVFAYDWALTRYRMTGITNETGGHTEVKYSTADCEIGVRMPASPESNSYRCYPTWWTPSWESQPVLDWFHKYVVTDVIDDDRTGASDLFKVHYDYLDGGAWHFDENEFADPARRTWSQWRGYGKVRQVAGEIGTTQTVTESTFMRGMHGDKLPSGTRSVTVSTSEGEPINDLDRLRGFVREIRQYDNGQLVSASVNDPWVSAATATAADGTQATLSNISSVRGRTLLESGAWRRMTVNKTFDAYGMADKVEDLGDVAVTGDESCTRTTYARNTAAWLVTFASTVQAVNGTCAVAASATTIRSEARSYFDGQNHGVAPIRGTVTKAEALDKWAGATKTWVTASQATYDPLGRPLEVYDSAGEKTTTVYTPASGPVRSITSTNPLGHVSTVQLEPAWNATTASMDANGRRSDLEYDALGRMLRAWAPGHVKNRDLPDAVYEYTYNTNAPTVVATKQLQDDNSYQTAYTLYDGLLRERQTQTQAPGGGRMITDTRYDSRGLAYKKNAPYYNDQAASATLAGAVDSLVPNQTITLYDGMARSTAAVYRKYDVEQWRTTTSYGGDRIHSTPAPGGTATTVISDASGRTTEKRQYSAGLGSSFDATKYDYNAAGHIASITDAVGNAWTFGYDLRGRKITSTDPDAGTSSATFDAAGRTLTSTDARGKTLAFQYDKLGRMVARHDGSTSGTKLAEWQYDTVTDASGQLNGRGMLALSRRWANGYAYLDKVMGYDASGRQTGRKVIVPTAAEGKLGTTYEVSFTYTWTGKLKDTWYRDVYSGTSLMIPGESFGTGYDNSGLADTMVSGLHGALVSDTTYSPYGEVLREDYAAEDSQSNVALTNQYEVGTRRLQTSATHRETQTSYEVTNRRYTYDAAGNVTKVADTPQAGLADTQCFAYDHLRRLADAWTPGSGDCAAAKSTGSLGGAAPYWRSWTFDKTGNRLTETSHEAAGDTVRTSAYPAAGTAKPHTLTSVTSTGPNGTAQDTFTYNEVGATKTRNVGGNTQTLEYDVEGRVSKVKHADGKESTYLYDADGNRLIAREPSAKTLYVFGQEVRLDTGTTTPTWTRYYAHNGKKVALYNSVSGLFWMVGDHQGTNLATVKAGTLAVTKRRQLPYGGERGVAPASWPDRRGFVGANKDESGLSQMGARLYDEASGRFLSADPIVDINDPQQMNGYAYAGNTPITLADPSGQFACPDGDCRGNKGPNGKNVGPPSTWLKNQWAQEKVLKRYWSDKARNWDNQLKAKGIAPAAIMQAKIDAKKTTWDVIVEVSGELIKGITGWEDIVSCFSDGDILSCVGLIIELVPIGRIGKIIDAGWDALKAIRSLDRIREGAQGLLKSVDDMAEQAEKVLPFPVGGSCKRRNSFVAGTGVVLADGTSKPIEQVKIGDRVRAANPYTGVTGVRSVVATIVHDDEGDMTELVVESSGRTEVINATSWHRVWSVRAGAFVPIGRLAPGDVVVSATGQRPMVKSVRLYHQVRPVFDLTVDGAHTYFVGSGVTSLLVHNTPEDPISMDEAVARGAAHVDGQGTMGVSGSKGYQFVHHTIDADGNKITKLARFDINQTSSHVQVKGPHLNLETQVNGKTITSGPLQDPHTKIDIDTVRPGDTPC